MYQVIPVNVCVETLFPFDMESYQFMFPQKNDIIPGIGDVNVF